MNDEIAEATLDQTIIDSAFLAAKTYETLHIVCPWCRISVLGANFAKHVELIGHRHRDQEVIVPTEFYERLLVEHGNSPKSLDWSVTGQNLRFQVLAQLGIGKANSVLDVGCGLGHFIRFLETWIPDSYEGEYLGIDASEKMIEHARALHGVRSNCSFAIRDALVGELPVADYVVSSGLLNLDQGDNQEAMESLIERCYVSAVRGCAINMLSTHAETKRPGRFYYKPEKMLAKAFSVIPNDSSPCVALRHDYRHNDFTLYLMKTPPTFKG